MPRLPRFIASPTERTTAATDVLLAALASGCAVHVQQLRAADPQKAHIWSAAYGTLAVAGGLGAVAHGFEMSHATNARLWQPLNLALGTTIALFVAGVLHDAAGPRAARRALLPLLTLAGGFFAFTLRYPGSYLSFLIYQSGGILFALGAYVWLAVQRQQPGAGWMSAGVLASIIAAAIEAQGQARLRLIWEFNHSGVYHLVQSGSLLLLLAGLRRSLRSSGAFAAHKKPLPRTSDRGSNGAVFHKR